MNLERQVAEVLDLDYKDFEFHRSTWKNISKEMLEDLYANQGLSITEIANRLKVSRTTIHRRLQRYNISAHSCRKLYLTKEELEDLYISQRLSTYQIAKINNVSRSVVSDLLKKYSIPLRSQSESVHLSEVNHCNLSDKAIEWINGELLGDGCLYPRSKYSACFMYSSKYKEYIEYVSRTLNSFGIKQAGKIKKRVRYKSGKTVVYKNKITEYDYASLSYEELLPIRQKWYPNDKKIVPKDIELTPLTCRQWIIGDGSLIHHINKNPCIVLYTNGFTVEDVEFLVYKLNELGFKVTRQPANNIIYISPYSTPDFLNYIGKCPVKCYQYKWDLRGGI